MNLRYIWSDGTNPDFLRFSEHLEAYFDRLAGGAQNRKSFLPYNTPATISCVLLAYDGDTPVACGGLRKYSAEAAEVKRVFVREDYRGNGISKVIMEKLEVAARQKGFSKLILETREACTEAVGLYLSLGFQRTDNYQPYIGMPLAVCFAKALKSQEDSRMNYKVIDLNTYYRKGVFRHFSEDCKCSVSLTNRVDVTDLYACSKQTGTKFYINFLYLLTRVLNSRDDYRMSYLYQTKQIVLYDKINPTHYIFHADTETCTPVYSEYFPDWKKFYDACAADIASAKLTREYALDAERHPNWFDASYVSWLSYDSLNIELPDGYLYFMPIINWGKFRRESGRLMMPLTVRMNHAVADGYLVSKVFLLLEEESRRFVAGHSGSTETEGI